MHNEKLIDDLLELDFANIENQNMEDNKKRKKKMLEDAQIFFHTFNTDEGQLALKHMMQTFLVKSIAKPNDDMVSIGIREGQARVVRWILQQIEIAKEG